MTTRRRLHAAALAALLAACGSPPPLPPGAAADCRGLTSDAPVGPATPVHWQIMDAGAGRAELDAYCAAVGAPVRFVPAPDPTRRDTAADPRLVVVSWNIALGAGDVGRLIADVRAGVHTGGAAVRDFVLLLQEAPRLGADLPAAAALPRGVRTSVPDPPAGPDVRHAAAAAGLHLFYVPSMREGTDTLDTGTAILSTLPLSGLRAIELPAGIRRRVAVLARVEWPTSPVPLYVVSAHLDNFDLRRLRGSFGRVRARQARALRAVLPDTGVIVLGGDLNTWARGRREAAYRTLRQALPLPLAPQTRATARRLGIGRQLDYLMAAAPAGWDFQEVRLAHRHGSDHHPLLGILTPGPR